MPFQDNKLVPKEPDDTFCKNREFLSEFQNKRLYHLIPA